MPTQLLAPAGSLQSLKAAVNAGADAVYTGGRIFSARAYADNPEEDDLLNGIRYAHRFGVKVHLTVNTLIKEAEIKELHGYIEPYYQEGLDAVIVQDIGAAKLIHDIFPGLDIHASTQMTVTSEYPAKYLKALGIKRIIPARELSMKEIIRIKKETGMEVETFVHGALCYSYSGQCLMSSLIGGRSGNRGRCAQTCRLSFSATDGARRPVHTGKNMNLLSCGDLCSLDLIPEIIDAEIDSLKIEGRMKSARYTAGVVSIWRKYLDIYDRHGRGGFEVSDKDREYLLNLFDRGTNTTGYYFKENGPDMMAMAEKPKYRAVSKDIYESIDRKYVNSEKKRRIKGELILKKDIPLFFSVMTDDNYPEGCASAGGEIPQTAKNAELSEDNIREKILKTKDTPYLFSELKINCDRGLFVPVSHINELRRKVLGILDRELTCTRKNLPVTADNISVCTRDRENLTKDISPKLCISCETAEQLEEALKSNAKLIYIAADMTKGDEYPEPDNWKSIAGNIHSAGKKAGLMFPQIFRTRAQSFFDSHIAELKTAGFDCFLVRSIDEAGYINDKLKKEDCPELVFDYTIYCFNLYSAAVLKKMGAYRLTFPAELNFKECISLKNDIKELVIYGRFPMMVSAQCLKKNILTCNQKPEMMYLRDRKNMIMPVKNHCLFCYNNILNAKPLMLAGMEKQIKSLNPDYLRIMLTSETPSEASEAISMCEKFFLMNEKPSYISDNYTFGHMKRGVE